MLPITFVLAGSSPRVWGQETVEQYIGLNDRIIPTRMGTSEWVESPLHDREDHPHAYGDK